MENLQEKIKKIEALILGTQTKGEKNATISDKDRILKKKYPELEINRDAVEFNLSTTDYWHKKLLLAICRKYGLKPYRYKRQKYTTVMVYVNEVFLNTVVWKEYLEYSRHLESLVDDITNDLISKIHKEEDEDLIHGNLK